MDDENETPSNTHKEKQDLMQKALDDIMKNGPKLRLGHVPAPSLNDLDNQSFKKPKFNQRDEQRGSSPKGNNPRNNSRKFSGNQRRNNRKREYKVPEHIKNPSKFKKYDLSDVKLTDGKQNSAAALSFLAELKDRKREPEEKSFDPDNDKIQFNRPKSNKIKTNQENAESSSSKTKVGGGILLDEYVVGMAKPRVPKYRSKATNEPAKSSENKIELDHLEHSWKDELEITAEAKINPSIIPKKDEVSEGFKSRKKSKKAKMRDRKQLSFDDE